MRSPAPDTDLEHLLKCYGKEKIICVGLSPKPAWRRRRGSACFRVTLVHDGTAASWPEAYHVALNIDGLGA